MHSRKTIYTVVKSKRPLLKAVHRQKRLKFAHTHANWTVEDWKRVLWSDETKINRIGSDGKVYTWKPRGESISDRTTSLLRTFHFFLIFLHYLISLLYLIFQTLFHLTFASPLTRVFLIPFIHAFASLSTCLRLISFLYLPFPFSYINPVDYACKP